MEINSRGYRRIINYSEGCKNVHETAEHGLAICYKEERARFLEEYNSSNIIAFPVSMEICGEKILLVFVNLPARQQVTTFIDSMISIFMGTWKGEWIILLVDFMLQENINRLVSLKEILCYNSA